MESSRLSTASSCGNTTPVPDRARQHMWILILVLLLLGAQLDLTALIPVAPIWLPQAVLFVLFVSGYLRSAPALTKAG